MLLVKMNQIFVLLVLCVIHKNVYADMELTAEQKEMLTGLHNACVGESGVAENLISDAAKGKIATDEKLKCYMKCLYASIGVMDDDGTMDWDAYIDLMPDAAKSFAEETATKCKSITPEGNACETAFKINKCSYEANPQKYFLF